MGDSKGESKLSFAVQLWDGFEVTVTRLTKGRHDVKEAKRFMEERALIEDTYAKSLKKAGAHFGEFEEKTSLSASWQKTLSANEQIAKHHEQLSLVCTEIGTALEALSNEIKNAKSKALATHTKILTEKKKRMERHDRCKKQYYESVKQAETATINLDNGKNQNLPDKAILKLDRTKKASLKFVEDSHDAYKKSVSSLAECQAEYDSTMAVLLQEFEVLELRRLTVLKEQANRFCQSHDFLKSSIEQMAILLKEGVAAARMEQDVQDFIKSHVTGKTPPEHVQYKPQASDVIGHMVDGKSSFSSTSTPLKAGSSLATIERSASTVGDHTPPTAPSITSSPSHGPPSGPPPGHAKVEPKKASVASELYAKALYDFESEEADDLPFPVNAVIKLLQSPDAEDWWQGEYNGKRGMFPKNYVEKQPAGFVPGSVAPPVTNLSSSASSASSASSSASAVKGADSPKIMNAKCEALFDFEGQDTDDLSFKKGDTLIITGELDGWYLGKLLDSAKTGIFPSNYVKLK